MTHESTIHTVFDLIKSSDTNLTDDFKNSAVKKALKIENAFMTEKAKYNKKMNALENKITQASAMGAIVNNLTRK